MPVAIHIAGTGFHLPITTNLDQGTTEVGAMSVAVGGTPLPDATRAGEQEIDGTVPAGLAVGMYDVTVTIGDRSAVLPAGYSVTDGAGSGSGNAFQPLHLVPSDGVPGSAELDLSGAVTIDTSTTPPTISVPLPSGDLFDRRPQDGGGPDLAVLHVGALHVTSTATVVVTGTQPLVIVAGGDVDIDGVIDAGAHGATPGPGGAGPGMGEGAGMPGAHEATDLSDTGGGGASYGGEGAASGGISGTCTLPPSTAGATYGDPPIPTLVAGSGGGTSSGNGCPPDPGGAGGGAFQISSVTAIAITGAINVGGGGGHGATDCGAPSGDVNSGAGGGAGGSIVLQAPTILNHGTLAANGGGGGGSSATTNGNAQSGADGQPSASPAAGGTGPIQPGGNGATGTAPATAGGSTICGNNAGGGGGGVGRIAVSSGYVEMGTTSPAPYAMLPL